MRSNSGVETHTVDNLLCVQALAFRVGVQLIEVGHTKCQIGIGKQFHSLGFGKAHKQGVDVLLDGALLEESRKCMRSFSTGFITRYNNPAGI